MSSNLKVVFVDDLTIMSSNPLKVNNSVNVDTGGHHIFLLNGYDKRMLSTLLDDAVPPKRTCSYEDYISYRTTKAYQMIRKTREQLGTVHGVCKGYYYKYIQ